MIFVTSGYEQGIGLEVFLKALSETDRASLKNFHLFVSKNQLLATIKLCQLPVEMENESIKINGSVVKTTFLNSHDSKPLTTRSLELALDKMSNQDILLTLPTKKNQLILKNKPKKGYTEYLREFYKNTNLAMNFLSPEDNVLLLTDHIPLSLVESSITENLILNKLEITLKNFPKNRVIKEVFFSGINPHCGEDGMMGTVDMLLLNTIKKLREIHPQILFHDPKAGDTLYFNHKDNSQLFVFAFHDQGLAPFKLKNGLIGINLTLGLPFKRISVDHGTAPDIFGKNCADYKGMLYLLKEVQKWT